MKTQVLDNNCKVKLIHGLGSVHEWLSSIVTCTSLEEFKERLDAVIKVDGNPLSEYIEDSQKYYIAITHQPSQPNETQWLKELGFKQLEMGDGLVLSSMDYFTWSGQR